MPLVKLLRSLDFYYLGFNYLKLCLLSKLPARQPNYKNAYITNNCFIFCHPSHHTVSVIMVGREFVFWCQSIFNVYHNTRCIPKMNKIRKTCRIVWGWMVFHDRKFWALNTAQRIRVLFYHGCGVCAAQIICSEPDKHHYRGAKMMILSECSDFQDIIDLPNAIGL